MYKLTPFDYFVTNFWCILLSVLAVWIITHSILYFGKFNDLKLKCLELIYVLSGLLGLLCIVLNAQNFRYSIGLEHKKETIQRNIDELNDYKSNFCFVFSKTEWSPPNIEEIQHDYNTICEWINSRDQFFVSDSGIRMKIDSIDIDSFKLKTDGSTALYSLIKNYNNEVRNINNKLYEYYDRNIIVKSNASRLYSYLSVPFLAFALSIRLSITSYGIYRLRKKKK